MFVVGQGGSVLGPLGEDILGEWSETGVFFWFFFWCFCFFSRRIF